MPTMRSALPFVVLLAACEGVVSATIGEVRAGGVDAGGPTPGAGTVFVPDAGGVDAGEVRDAGQPPTADTGAPDASAPVDAGSPPCGPLASRVTTTVVPVGPASVDVGSSYGWSNNRPVHLAPLASGGAKIAWSAGSSVHVTTVDAALARVGADLVIPADSVRGFVAHEDGAVALLVVRRQAMVLVRVRGDGTTAFETQLVGDPPAMGAGARWVDGWGHEGRLVFTGQHYVALFGHTKDWGAMGRHQGDRLVSISLTGQIGGPHEWDWGCSHSLDVRLATSGGALAAVCLSDCYRSKGILLDSNTVLQAEPSGNCAGTSNAQLGGLTTLAGGGFGLVFASDEGRTSRDLGYVRLSPSLQPSPTVWLTTTPGAQESWPLLARYGASSLLVAWREGAGQRVALHDAAGALIDGPIDVPAGWAERDDAQRWPSGDVGWVRGAGAQLEVTRVRACE
jgi:hypothetical protein